MMKTKEIGIRLSVKDKEIAERALKAFGKEGQDALRRIEAAATPASAKLLTVNAAANMGKAVFFGLSSGAIAAAASLLSVGAAVASTKAALDQIGDIADRAKSTGLDVEFFQELVFQAELAGVAYDRVSGALETFVKNAGMAEAGKGRMVTALAKLNPELLKNLQLAGTQEERVRLAADAIDRAASASEKAAISVALFGDAGVQMVQVFEGGASAMAASAARARDLGIILDRELVARAEELGDQFDIATKVIDLQFKEALINLAPFLVSAANLAGNVAAAIYSIIDSMNALEDQSSKTLGNKRDQLLDEIKVTPPGWKGPQSELDRIRDNKRDEIAQIEAELRRRAMNKLRVDLARLPTSEDDRELPTSDRVNEALREAEALIKRLRTGAEEYSDTMSKLDQQLASGLIGQETYNRAMAEAVLKRADAVKGDEDYAATLAKVEEALARGIITEQQYTDAVEDMSRRRLEAANTWQAGILLGLDSIAEESRHIGRNIEDSLVSGVERFEDAWIKAMETGKFEWGDLAKQILLDLARMATRQMITGPISGLLSGLFGGGGGLRLGFQAGVGHTGAMIGAAPITRDVPLAMFAGAQRHHAGTDFLRPGEVPFIGMRGEEIGWPDQLRRKYGGAGRGGDVTVNVSAVYNTEGSGLSPDQLRHVFEQNNKALIGQVVPVVRKAIRDGAL